MATTYYLATAGSDTNNGTSSSTPFQTIGKVNSVAVTGDTVNLNRGDTFTGAFTAYVNLNTYGSGANPIVSGFKTLSTWTVQSNPNIYACQDLTLGSTVNILTYNGTKAQRGRMPKTGYYNYSSNSGNTSIYDASQSGSYVGGEVVIRKARFILDRAPITAMSGGTITYGAGPNNSSNNPTPGYGYFIQNHINCLTQSGDWCYDASTHTVYVYFGGTAPGTVTIQVSAIDTLYTVGASNLTLQSILFQGANKYAIANSGGVSNTTFTNCSALNIGLDAVKMTYCAYTTINGMVLSGIGNNGIIMPGASNANVTNVQGNTIGYYPGEGEGGEGSTGWGAYCGISVGANDPAYSYSNTVTQCRLDSVGYQGIYINGNSYTCTSNYINNYCMVLDDGGGIYTYAGATYTYTGRTISGNMISNGIGAPVSGSDTARWANGIYLDDGSNNTTLSNNTIFSAAQYGIFVHNSDHVPITGNTLYNNAVANLAMQHDSIRPSGYIRNVTFNNNYVICINNTQLAVMFASYYNGVSTDLTSWGTASGNYYATTATNANLFTTQINGGSLQQDTLGQWQAATTTDGSSTVQFITAATRWDTNSNNSSSTVTLSNNYVTLNGTSEPIGTLTIPALTGIFSIFSSSAPIPPPPTSYFPPVLMVGNTFSATQGTPIQINMPTLANVTGWSVDGNTATHVSCNTGKLTVSNYPLTVGQSYTVTYLVNSVGSGYVQLFIGGVAGPQATAPGLVTQTATAQNGVLYLLSNGDVQITLFSVQANPTQLSSTQQNTLAYSERTQKWGSFYTFAPEIGTSLYVNTYTFCQGKMYLHQHNSTQRCNFYGVQYPATIYFSTNEQPTIAKTFYNINYQANSLMVTPPSGINTSLGQVSQLIASDFLQENLNDGVNSVDVYSVEGIYKASFLRDMTVDIVNGDMLKGNYMTIGLQTQSPSGVLDLLTTEIGYAKSFGNTR